MNDEKYGSDPHWRTAGRWLVIWGVCIGVFYALVFRGAWRWFGEYQRLRFLPVMCIMIADFGWCGYHLLAGAVESISRYGRGSTTPASTITLPILLAVFLIGLVKLTMMVSLPAGARVWPADWRGQLGFLYPQVIYRPLILMPIWGRWAMMLAITLGRLNPNATLRLKHMAGGMRLPLVLLNWLACAGLTVLYCSASAEHLAHGVIIALGVMVGAYMVSFLLARRLGGQSEATIRCTALAGELIFLAFYIPFASDIFWY